MHYKAQEVKGIKAAEVRETLLEYIDAVQPNCGGEVVTEKLKKAILARSADISETMRWFLVQERLIADKNKDYRIHDMIEYLRQVDRHVKKGKIAI